MVEKCGGLYLRIFTFRAGANYYTIMKFKYFILLVILPLLISCEKPNNDLKKHNLKGRVKSINSIQSTTTYKFGELTPDKMKHKNSYTYNRQGFLIESEWSYFVRSREMFYNKQSYEYDTEGLLTTIYKYDKEGKEKERAKFKYNDQKLNTEKNEYWGDGSLLRRTLFEYDEKGNKSMLEEFDNNNIRNLSQKFFYDDNNKLIRTSELGRTQSRVINGITHITTDSDTIVYRYNENGDEEFMQSKKYRHLYSYEYDEKSNWIKKIITREDSTKLIVERVIEYF